MRLQNKDQRLRKMVTKWLRTGQRRSVLEGMASQRDEEKGKKTRSSRTVDSVTNGPAEEVGARHSHHRYDTSPESKHNAINTEISTVLYPTIRETGHRFLFPGKL